MGKLNIVSRSNAPFANRIEAGRLLARELYALYDHNPVVLGIPRGGIIPARELAMALHGDLDVILSHKLRTPGQPELAMGAIAEGGVTFVDPQIVKIMGISISEIEEEKVIQMAELSRRTTEIRKVRPKVSLEGRTVIITDDGIATGATTLTALRAARFERPAKLILALPVGPVDSVRSLADEADETLCLRLPEIFRAVGQFYLDFDQVSDKEMLDILKETQKKKEEKIKEKRGKKHG